MTRTRLRRFRLLGLLLLLLLGGCPKKYIMNAQVEGTVKIDGAPLPNIVVQLVPDVTSGEQSPGSTGATDEQGHYALTCDNGKAGAVLGKYRVVVLAGRGGGRGDDREAGGVRRTGGTFVPPVYGVAAKTPLKMDVTADQHTYDLNLSRAAQ
jgi:hypothetical protein